MHPQLLELHQDHINLAKILHLMEKHLDDVRVGENVDLDMLSEIVDYVQSYPDRFHHQHENIIFSVYLENPDREKFLFQRLIEEHVLLVGKTLDLREHIEEWRQDCPVLRETIVSKMADYLNLQWEHLNLEEASVFDLLDRELTSNEWERIAASRAPASDPLFGEQMKQRFVNIFEQLFA